jgi:hypothetical protein
MNIDRLDFSHPQTVLDFLRKTKRGDTVRVCFNATKNKPARLGRLTDVYEVRETGIYAGLHIWGSDGLPHGPYESWVRER